MATDREIIWLGRDNTIDLVFYAEQSSGTTIVDLSTVTQIDVTFGSGTTVSSSTSPTLFSGVTSPIGEVTFKFGSVDLTSGKYRSEIIVYDPDNSNGIVWDKIPIIVKG